MRKFPDLKVVKNRSGFRQNKIFFECTIFKVT